MESARDCSFRQVLAHLQLLCCSGLDGRVVMPVLLCELRSLVVSSRSHFLWLDEQQRPCHSCSYHLEPEKYPAPCERIFHEYSGCLNKTPGNQIFHPIDDAATLFVPIRVEERVLGILILHRRTGDPPFTEPEKQRLAQLVPYYRADPDSSSGTAYPVGGYG